MSQLAPPPTNPRGSGRAVAAVLLLAVAATTGAVVSRSAVSVSTVGDTLRGELGRPTGAGEAVGEADGVLPAGVTVFDDSYPGVSHLSRGLLRALRRATTAAAAGADGIEVTVNSGWRSPAYQDRLLREAVSTYGSETEAARWVATADTSPHVHGDAVDVGPAAATAWLSAHGAAYGLCQVYGNEPWHFELRRSAVDRGCPPPYADPTHDPRMR